jgi:hypothetical protein
MDASDQLHAPAALTPQSQFGHGTEEKISTPARNLTLVI